MRVMIVVTHLLGTGHLSRALTLARAFHAAGDDVQVVSGGMAADHLNAGQVDLVALSPVRSDGVDFSRLLGPDGPIDDAYLKQRISKLLGAFDAFAPDLLMTELFPFGRRILREEFQALLTHAVASDRPPLICASIRDILAPPSKPRKAAFADEMLSAFYDAVLVHGDADLTPLNLSWPVDEKLAPMLHYTGFVAPDPAAPHPDGIGVGEVLVSAGGGDVGAHIFEAAIAAAAMDNARKWRLLVGGANAARIADLVARAPENATVEPARPDFRSILSHAAASVSMCGYNTALDVLQTGVPAVFVPFDEGAEVEQGLRASALSHQPGITALPRDALTARSLLDALANVCAAPPRTPDPAQFDGAARTVEIAHALRSRR